MTDPRDELDYDEFEETLAALRDHLRASDLVSVAEANPDEAREAIASLLAVIRHAAETMGTLALVLRGQPALRERVARGLDEVANALNELVLDEGENDD
jgi:hypothetical protein